MRLLTGILLSLLPLPAVAQPMVTSPAPEQVSVSVYRDPYRPGGRISTYWPTGFALITETRTIEIPAGDAIIRFEGVADSILSESAIVTGLPGGVSQKNRDAAVLSPAALIEFALGKAVNVRRTDRATGTVREEEAIVRAGPGGGIVIQSAAGIEALRCSGLPEALTFDRVPPGLSDKPVLSVATVSREPVRATVTLSYLAGGFDWNADYIAQIAPDGRTMDLFAWATLANATGQSFVQAETNTIAGRLNRRSGNSSPRPPVTLLELGCWPMGTTSDVSDPEDYPPPYIPPPPPPPPSPPPPPVAFAPQSIVVTGSRMRAVQEELGDLKLYRIPEPVTVAARSQKQVAMIDQLAVPIERLLEFRIDATMHQTENEARRLIRTRNDKASNLGLPLPSGKIAFFQQGGDRPFLAGRGQLDDHAVGEEVEISTGTSSDVQLTATITKIDKKGRAAHRMELSNASGQPQRVEVRLYDVQGARLVRPSRKLGRKDGVPVWEVTLPANGRAELTYTIARGG